MATRILIVDDEPNIRTSFTSLLKDEGYQTDAVPSAEQALVSLTEHVYNLLLLDLQLPGMGGLELLDRLTKDVTAPTVLVISGQADIPDALQAVRLGAVDFLEKPVQPEKLIASVRAALALHDAEKQRLLMVDEIDESARIVGRSPAVTQLINVIRQIAPTDSTVLITGQNGTGKELVATRLYLESKRRDRPFVRVNCPGIPETLFESQLFGHMRGSFTGAVKDHPGKFVQADGGTIFLDEIGDLPLPSQAKLLRVLETGEVETLGAEHRRQVDVRVVCATNRDLNKLVADEKFRQDLYYRISVMMIEVPPLSARSEDIPLLVGEFLKRFDPAGETHFAPAAMAALSASTYPGNVRQLKNLVERMTILRAGRTVEVQDLGLAASELPVTNVATDESASLATRLARFERELVAHTLRECKGNISETARQLQVDRANLSRKIHELGLKPGDH